MLIPGTDFILCGDKHGVLTLLNRKALGKLSSPSHGQMQSFPVNGGRVLNGPVWWQGPAGASLYLWGEADALKAFHFNGAAFDTQPFAKSTAASHGSPGGALTISANGAKADTGIVWAALTLDKSADHGNAAGILRAFNAETLEELWNSEADAARDGAGTLVKFVPPTVVGGKVYAASYDNVVNVYGLLEPADDRYSNFTPVSFSLRVQRRFAASGSMACGRTPTLLEESGGRTSAMSQSSQ
jgi:outer membrane protein assembly factor BamB